MAGEKGAVGHAEDEYAGDLVDTDIDLAARIGCGVEVTGEGEMAAVGVSDMAMM